MANQEQQLSIRNEILRLANLQGQTSNLKNLAMQNNEEVNKAVVELRNLTTKLNLLRSKIGNIGFNSDYLLEQLKSANKTQQPIINELKELLSPEKFNELDKTLDNVNVSLNNLDESLTSPKLLETKEQTGGKYKKMRKTKKGGYRYNVKTSKGKSKKLRK